MNTILPGSTKASFSSTRPSAPNPPTDIVELTSQEEETLASVFPENPEVTARLYGKAAQTWSAGALNLGQHVDTTG